MYKSRHHLTLKRKLHFKLNWLISNTYWNKTCCGVQELVKQTSHIFTVCPGTSYMICHPSALESLSQENFRFPENENGFKCFPELREPHVT